MRGRSRGRGRQRRGSAPVPRGSHGYEAANSGDGHLRGGPPLPRGPRLDSHTKRACSKRGARPEAVVPGDAIVLEYGAEGGPVDRPVIAAASTSRGATLRGGAATFSGEDAITSTIARFREGKWTPIVYRGPAARPSTGEMDPSAARGRSLEGPARPRLRTRRRRPQPGPRGRPGRPVGLATRSVPVRRRATLREPGDRAAEGQFLVRGGIDARRDGPSGRRARCPAGRPQCSALDLGDDRFDSAAQRRLSDRRHGTEPLPASESTRCRSRAGRALLRGPERRQPRPNPRSGAGEKTGRAEGGA